MSIASEIARLQSAKSCIKWAIESKWVTVPNDLKLQWYTACINSIPTWYEQWSLMSWICIWWNWINNCWYWCWMTNIVSFIRNWVWYFLYWAVYVARNYMNWNFFWWCKQANTWLQRSNCQMWCASNLSYSGMSSGDFYYNPDTDTIWWSNQFSTSWAKIYITWPIWSNPTVSNSCSLPSGFNPITNNTLPWCTAWMWHWALPYNWEACLCLL